MVWLGIALWSLTLLAALRRSAAFGVGVLLSFALPSTALTALTGLERLLAPLLLLTLSLGLFLPPARPARAPRVAPRKRTRSLGRTFGGSVTPTLPPDTTSPLDLWDIPGYQVLEKVGSGGMASVFRAQRKRDGQIVALKIPAEQFVSDEKFVRRFHREAEVVQHLTHPNIVQTFEHGCVGSKHFMAMEFVAGQSLELYLDDPENRRDYVASCELMTQAVRALSHIHEVGVIHRDIKPANLMLREGARSERGFAPDALKLMDFGIAGGQVATRLTVMGARIGTPTYMSPEQARGLRSDERSDIYSLGLVFYELLTGQAAFRGGYEVILHQQIFQMPPSPRQLEPRIPLALDRLVMQMIQKEPEARPSLAEIAYRLSEGFDVPDEEEPKSRLLCAIEATTGAGLHVLDTLGNLRLALGDIGKALPAPPKACVADSQGNLYVAVLEEENPDTEYAMLHKLSPTGDVLLSFGAYGLAEGEFLRPVALAVAPDDSLWVLDAETHRLEHFSAWGAYLGGFGGSGEGGGHFNDPRDLMVNLQGELFVLDYGNRQVQHFASDGSYLNRWAFRASEAVQAEHTTGGIAALRLLSGIALGGGGELYLTEAESGKVHRIAAKGGSLDTFALDHAEGDQSGPDTLVDLGVDESGNLFTAERGSSAIRKYSPGGELLATLETYAPILQLRVDVRA